MFSKNNLIIFLLILIPSLNIGCGSSSNSSSGLATNTSFGNFRSADLVIGQTLFTTNVYTTPTATSVLSANDVAFDASYLFIVDGNNSRIKRYNSMPTTNGAAANSAIGQAAGGTNLTSANSGTNADQFTYPTSAFVWGSYLLVADGSTNKVMIWPTLPAPGDAASVAVGHNAVTGIGSGACSSSTVNGPNDVFVTPSGKIIVADQGNNRIMIWNDISSVATGAAANVILGDHASCAPGATSSRFNSPTGIWSDDLKLAVADYGNNRVLIWNTFPTANGDAADVVIGQNNFTGTAAGTSRYELNNPYAVASDGDELFVSDYLNNRILVWGNWPTSNGASASYVLGQSSFTLSTENDDDQDSAPDAGPSNRTLYWPTGILYKNGQLFVADTGNNRILVFQK